MRVTAVAGNPKPGSRTLDAAVMLAESIAPEATVTEVDVIELGAGLLGWGNNTVRAAVEKVAASDLVVFASPTFKATYSGVMKLFLDQFATGEGLRDVIAVPLMLGGGPSHAMAPELLLRPVLTELGAACPAPGLYLLDNSYTTDGKIAEFVDRWGGVLTGTITAASSSPERMAGSV
ncbi:MAG: NAD(P)H-dependent oxidoreductase [Dietzia sp.]|nr:NAD(P)H-dependent oxidoreductase [Dietzia sp.]